MPINSEPLLDLDQLIDPIKEGVRHSILTDKNGREYLWNDSCSKYEALETNPIQLTALVRKVSTVQTLVDVIKEEARRADNKTGDLMTVMVDDHGATYFPNDKPETRHLQWRYKRALGSQWDTLFKTLGKTFSSLDFYKRLLELSDSIQGGQDVLAAFQKVRVVDKSEFQDQNHFAGGDYAKKSGIKIKVRGGDEDMELSIPDEIRFKLPVVRGSDVLYELTALVEISTHREADKTIAKFGLSVPTLDLTTEKLLLDEVEYIRKHTKELPDLLVGLNYSD